MKTNEKKGTGGEICWAIFIHFSENGFILVLC